MSQAVYIAYGFNEGPGLARRFIRTLTAHGYRIVRQIEKADIVIAHSGGCFLLPDQLPGKRVILIGLTYNPGHPLWLSIVQKVIWDARHHHSERARRFWLYKTVWNSVYFWQLWRPASMWRGMHRNAIWRMHPITLVRNEHDLFCTPDLATIPFTHAPRIVELPGHHDDLWLNPERYLDVIQS